jgi:hypothetical protein
LTWHPFSQYIHQLGSRINSYTATLFGADRSAAMSRKRSAPPRHNDASAATFRNVDSFVSVKSALTVPSSGFRHPNYTPQVSIL